MNHSNRNSKIIGALMVGTVIGAAMGILFAPQKGRKTRRNIAKGTQNLANSAKDLTHDLAQQAKKGYTNGMNTTEKASSHFDGLASDISSRSIKH